MDNPFESPIPEKFFGGNANPWRRRMTCPNGKGCFVSSFYVNSRKEKFYDVDLDLNTKSAVLKAAPSVVALASSADGKQVFWGSGVIFESSWENGSFTSLVITSATLLRPPRSDVCNTHKRRHITFSERFNFKPEEEGYITIDERIDVYVAGGDKCDGSVVASDFHYNIAVLKFKTDNQLPCAVLRHLDVSFDDVPPINSRLRLVPGDDVIAVGRYTEDPYEIMAAPGKYSSKGLDKIELLRANCLITKCGIGGPLISCKGEVIGINFYAEECTPFLPINIFSLWWSRFNVTGASYRPWMRMEVANLHYKRTVMKYEQLAKLDIFQGVRVTKVLPSSPAEMSDLRDGDVIVKCNGIPVTSTLQLVELIWGLGYMAGKCVEARCGKRGAFFSNHELKS